jgi:hypothetical protein
VATWRRAPFDPEPTRERAMAAAGLAALSAPIS